MIYRNTCPEVLEAIAIGPDPSFLAKNTTYCEFVSAFPAEVELMYNWKAVKKSSNPLNALRNFTKKLIINGPDLDVQTLDFFVKKVTNQPNSHGDTIKNEVKLAFDKVKNITTTTTECLTTTTTTTDIYLNGKKIGSNQSQTTINACYVTNNTEIHNDNNFLNKLANLLRTCKRPCNYFVRPSSTFGTLADFGRALSDSASILGDTFESTMHAPVNVARDMLNKINPIFRSEFYKLKVMTEDVYRDGVKPFFSKEDRERVKEQSRQGLGPDSKYSRMGANTSDFERLPLTGDTATYYSAAGSYSEVQGSIRQRLGDCFRRHEYLMRYNPYDPEMNTAYSKRKYIGLRNGDTTSLIDITGSLAPSQYATENTYSNALDIPRNQNIMKYEDTEKAALAKDYNNGKSKANDSVITAGNGPLDLAASSGSTVSNTGETIPTTGKTMEFGFGEVKITKYGYPGDSTPDSGSEMAIGNSDNLLQPLKSIAVAPETLRSKIVKTGDVLIITCTDKSGNVFKERRQVADTSAGGLLTGKYKFLIDEYVPNGNYRSRLYGADGNSDRFKMSIMVADTKEPLAKWTVQEASQYASMFFSKTAWNDVKVNGQGQGLRGRVHASVVSGQYDAYCRFS
jgi:hypothetical protein